MTVTEIAQAAVVIGLGAGVYNMMKTKSSLVPEAELTTNIKAPEMEHSIPAPAWETAHLVQRDYETVPPGSDMSRLSSYAGVHEAHQQMNESIMMGHPGVAMGAGGICVNC